MKYEIKEFELKGLDGISDDQISQHRDILYAGYVNKLNEITEGLSIADLTKANQIFSHFRALKAEESFALNGVILHELYFGNLGGDGAEPTGQLHNLMARDFGPFERWVNNFKACGMAARGWVILGLSAYDGMLHNYCLDSHNSNFPALCTPLLVMDVYEHAYAIDYGVKRAPYIDAFMKNINWEAVVERLERFEGAKTTAG
jgi:Fe-Mn family superoxide dismutase